MRFSELNRCLPLFLLSSSGHPTPIGLPAPPIDKSTSNRFRSSCFLYLNRSGPVRTSLNGCPPLFLLSSSGHPTPIGLPAPPIDKSTSNRFRSSCFLYLNRSGPVRTSLNGCPPLFLLSSSGHPTPIGLPAPPIDK